MIDNIQNKSNIPTPIHCVREANNKKLEVLKFGSSTKITWGEVDIRVTLTMKKEVAFYEPDVIDALMLTNDKAAERIESIKRIWGDLVVDPDEDKLLLEPALYFYAMFGETKECRSFLRWVCKEVLPAIRMSGVYFTGKIHGMDLADYLKTAEMNHDLYQSRINKNHDELNEAQAKVLANDVTKVLTTHFDHVLAERMSEFVGIQLEHSQAQNKKLDALSRMFHESMMPDNTSQKRVAEGKINKKPEKIKPTAERKLRYELLYTQASLLMPKRVVTTNWKSLFESLNELTLDQETKEKSLVDWISRKHLDLVDSFLESCESFVKTSGLEILTIESYENLDSVTDKYGLGLKDLLTSDEGLQTMYQAYKEELEFSLDPADHGPVLLPT